MPFGPRRLLRSLNRAGAAVSSGDVPAVTSAVLRIWLRADTLGLADNDAVGTWPDESGFGNDAVQSTGSLKPLFRTGIQNGLPIVRFDGTDDEMDIPDAAGLDGDGDGYTIFLMMTERTISAGAENVFLTKWNTGVDTTYQIDNFNQTNPELVWFTAATATDVATNSFTTTSGLGRSSGTFDTLTFIYDRFNTPPNTGITRVRKNGSAITASLFTVVPGVVPDSGGIVRLGGPINFHTQQGDMDLGEFLFYDGTLDATDLAAVEGYLLAKWAT